MYTFEQGFDGDQVPRAELAQSIKRKISFVNHRGQKLYQEKTPSVETTPQHSISSRFDRTVAKLTVNQKKPRRGCLKQNTAENLLSATSAQFAEDSRNESPKRYPSVLITNMSKSRSEAVSSERSSLKRIQVTFDPFKKYNWPRNLIKLTKKLKKEEGVERM